MITNFAHVLGALIFMQLFAGIVRGMRLDFDPTRMPLPSTAAWVVLIIGGEIAIAVFLLAVKV